MITYARREPNTFYAFLKRKNSRERTKRMKNVRDILIHIFLTKSSLLHFYIEWKLQ